MPTERIAAPDGRRWFALEPVDGEHTVQLIVGAAGNATYRSALTWADWFPISAAWDPAGRIWVSSADTGVAVFVRDGESWQRWAWEAGDTAARPELFDVRTHETVSWIKAEPPPELQLPGQFHA